MSPSKQKKDKSLSILVDKISSSSCIFVLNYKGISAGDFYQIRRSISLCTGDKIIVAKNSVIKVALKSLNLSCLSDESILSGQNAIIVTNSPIEVASIISEYAQKSIISISAYSDKSSDFSGDFVSWMSRFKNQNGLKSALLCLLKEPASSIARLLNQKVNVNV